MSNETKRTYEATGFKHYGTDSLFAGALVVSLVFHAFTVSIASRNLAKEVDVTQLAIVDVKKAQVELQREMAARKKEPPKPKQQPKQEKLPPPPKEKAAPVLRVKPVPMPVFNPGQRISAGRGSARGIEISTLGEGGQEAGKSGAGTGVHEGATGTGSGEGHGAATINPNPPGPAAAPPPPEKVEAPVVKKEEPAPPPPPPPPPAPKREEHKNVQARVEPPVILSSPNPELPGFMQEEGGTGEVEVQFTVRADGSIADVTVIRSTDHRLNSLAIAAAKRIKARPAMQNGEPRDFVFTKVYQFVAS